jgi:hypothetical protein
MEEWTEILDNGGTLDSIYMYMDYILVSGFAKIAAVSFNAFGCIPSGPGDLFGFISSSNLRTSFSSIWCN